MADDTGRDSDLLELILESATDFAIFTLDDQGKATSWNIGSERLLGYSSEEMIGHDSDVIFTPEDRANGVPERERRESQQRGRVKDERWHMRRDGTRFWGSGLMMPLKDRPGQNVKILRDFTAQHNAEQQLRESREQFRLLATSIPQLVFRTQPNGQRTWGSPQWASFTGLADMESRGLGWLDGIHPDDRERTLTGWRNAVSKGEYYCEHRVLRIDDGTYRWHQTRAKPVDPEHPATSEWVGTSADIHDLRTLQDTQALLMAELQHRTRNLLAVVQAVAQQIRRSAQTVEEFVDQFAIRLRALSRVQGILSRSDDHIATLSSIIEAELAAYVSEYDMQRRIHVHGPNLTLDAGATQTLALALHELTTNAVKHGALGNVDGTLEIMWVIEEEYSEDCALALLWIERGVPLTQAPARTGYGMELVQRALPYQLGAKTTVDFEPEGLRCAIRVPFHRLRRDK